ncbi:hypothetical protein NP493_35g02031 [Ridgeia piscesae]|uniref:CS domain-containing protein n=1 Tax=Ridgeia piscesae TaxID=27915 RepID=A0AAD9PCG4_RIDPI|nr:hypothetical protein NP493_35g02031 [Ridgeia piscesae]
MLQLFSQGTADLLLDTCTDYWDGNDLCVLNDTERKKIADFFQRTSMSSYCTAFAYRPLPQVTVSDCSNVFIEVPATSRDVFQHLKSPSPHRQGDCHQYGDVAPRLKNHYSVDSLVTADVSGSTSDLDTCFKAQCNQIFIGMITMQYQAKQDIVKLIEDLESACIRFVHFSQENELRSRVFSEKMGLEAGWNCHISLLNDKTTPGRSDMSSNTSHRSGDSGTAHHTHRRSVMLHLRVLDEARNQHRRRSAPGIVNLLHSPKDTVRSPVSVSCDTDARLMCDDTIDETFTDALLAAGDRNDDGHHVNVGGDNRLISGVSPTRSLLSGSLNPELKVCGGGDDTDKHSDAESSYTTDYSDSVIGGLGLANTANLPKGIENIRPHLENIDNVPLLVSLFTDCTAETTLEMLRILQECGEVVCCFGSAASHGNTGLFLHADCSIAMEPLYPPICARHQVLQRSRGMSSLSPMQLSARLNSIPCSLAYERDHSVNIIQLIVIARHHCQSVRNTFVFYLTCQLTLTTVQLVGCLLPPCLAPDHLLWLTLVVIPLLSLTMMGNPQDPRMGQLAQGKNLNHITSMSLLQFVGHHLMRCLPIVLLCLLCHSVNLTAMCHMVTNVSNVTCCHILGSIHCSDQLHTWGGWRAEYSHSLRLCQNFLASQLVLCFVFTSVSFLHRSHHLWQKVPSDNTLWRIIAPVVLVLQLLYAAVDAAVVVRDNRFGVGVTDIPIVSWVLLLLTPLILLSIHELVKRLEIKTDFYLLMKEKHEKLGFPPGQALKILVTLIDVFCACGSLFCLQQAFRKYEAAAKHDTERQLKKQQQAAGVAAAAKAPAAAATTATDTSVATTAATTTGGATATATTTIQSQPKGNHWMTKQISIVDKDSVRTPSPSSVHGASCPDHTASVTTEQKSSTSDRRGDTQDSAAVTPADSGQTVSGDSASAVSDQSIGSGRQSEATETGKGVGKPEKHKSTSKSNEDSDGDLELKRQQAAFQANPESYNGAVRENYRWSQSISDVDIRIEVPKHIAKGRDVRVDIQRKHLTMTYRDVSGEWVTAVDGDLIWDINKEECVWTLVPREHVHVNLEKVQERWWEAVLASEPTINVRNIDPSRPMSDLDDEAQAKIQEMMFNERQKQLGLPTSNEQKMQDMLKKAWDAEGSPFKGQPFDPSKVNLSGSNTLEING